LGIALRAAGLAEGGRSGIELLREAVEVLKGSPARLEYARAMTDLGAALRRLRHRAEAREPLALGLELAHRCGAPALVKRAREELLATGARPRRLTVSGRDALTPSEARIARMAADGQSTPAIAQALFVTPKTVETHLGHAYQKLDINSRHRLAQALQ
jgi:DNA-binding CsgD family transcriptional regulator